MSTIPQTLNRSLVAFCLAVSAMGVAAQTTTITQDEGSVTVENMPTNTTNMPEGSPAYITVTIPGIGTSDMPFLIGSVDEWNAFAWIVNRETNYKYRQSIAIITADITFINNHAQPYRFGGTIDGQGHTITLHQSDVKECTYYPYNDPNGSWGGLVFHIGNKLTIKNLRLAGTIWNQKYDCGTFIQNADGTNTVLNNCQSSVVIIKTGKGGNFTGGMIGGSDGSNHSIYIKNCLVNGRFTSSYTGAEEAKYPLNGGFMGRINSSTLDISNSYVHPQEVDNRFNTFYPFCNIYSGTPNITTPNSYYKFPEDFTSIFPTLENQGADKEAPATAAETVEALNAGAEEGSEAWIAHNDTVYLKTFAKYVDIVGWPCGWPNMPTVFGNNGNAEVTYQYKVKDADDATYTTTQPSDVGDYTVLAIVPEVKDETGRVIWNSWTSTMDFSITAAPTMTFEVTDYADVYDGEPHGISISVLDPETGVTVKYGETAEECTLDESPTLTDAGTKTVYYEVKAEGYAIVTDSAAITITPAELKVVPDADQSKEFGEEDPVLTYTTDGLLEGDEVTGALSREEGEEVGTYEILQGTLTAGNNYAINFTSGVMFTIEESSGIHAIKADTSNHVWYDLSGRRIQQPVKKGVYVTKGKKTVIW